MFPLLSSHPARVHGLTDLVQSSGTGGYGSTSTSKQSGAYGSNDDDTYGSGNTKSSTYGKKSSDDNYGSTGSNTYGSGNTGGSNTYGSSGNTNDDNYGSSDQTGNQDYGTRNQSSGSYGSGNNQNQGGDSTTGKILGKVGGLINSDKLQNLGADKRRNAGNDDY
jgi:hypothetical protein